MAIQRKFKLKNPIVSFELAEQANAELAKKWFDNQVVLTRLDCVEPGKCIYTDGINKLAIQSRWVYQCCVIDNFGYIRFFDKFKNEYFSCKAEDYKKGDEIAANANKLKLTDEQKKELTEVAKEKATFIGLKSLKGTQKQQDWAEQIRISKIENLDQSIANKLLSISVTNKAKFWIDNRYKTHNDFKKFVIEYESKKEEISFIDWWRL